MAIRSRVVTSTTTKKIKDLQNVTVTGQADKYDPKNPTGGYVYGKYNKTRRKLTKAEQDRANREWDKDYPGQRKGRNAAVASDNMMFSGSYGLYVPDGEPYPPAPAPKKTTTTTPVKKEVVQIGKLPIKPSGSLQITKPKEKLITKKLTTEVPVAIEKPTKKKVPKSAKADFVVVRGPGRFRSITGQKITGKKLTKGKIEAMGFVGGDKTARKAVKAENKSTRAARRTFGKEERLATGYLKNQGIIEGDTKKEMKSNIKSYSKSNIAAKKADKLAGTFEKTKAAGVYEDRKKAVKTAKKAIKYVGKLEKGKIRSFTPEALNKKKTVSAKVQTTTTGRGKNRMTTSTIVPTKKSTRTQAGRAVY